MNDRTNQVTFSFTNTVSVGEVLELDSILPTNQEYEAGLGATLTVLLAQPVTTELTISVVNTNPVIYFSTISNYFYNVQSTTNLAAGPWITISSNIPGSGNPTNYIDTNGTTVPAKFYRLGVYY